MKMKKLLILGITSLLLTVSCSVQKRLYNSGYHVSWKNKYQSVDKSDFITKENFVSDEREDNQDLATIEDSREIGNTQFSESINSKKLVEPISYTTTESKNKNAAPIKSTSKKLNSVPKRNKVSKFIESKKLAKRASKSSGSDEDILLILLVILCFLIPPLAVGIASDWDLTMLLISIILTLLFWIPGVLFALYIVLKDKF